MSWSLSSNGTKDATRRQVLGAKLHGTPSAEETETFEMVRAMFVDMIDSTTDDAESAYMTVIKLSASGHGKRISAVSFVTELVLVK
jgi:hypothetical protein